MMKLNFVLSLIFAQNAFGYSGLDDIIKTIEGNEIKRLPYKSRPVLSTKDTNRLKGKIKGINPIISQEFAPQEDRIDLREYDSSVKDQGQEGLCTAFATSAAIELLGNAEQRPSADLSEKHLWSLYREYYTIKALDAAKNNFITDEKVWPYKLPRPLKTIVPRAKINEYAEATTWTDVVNALRNKQGVVFSVETNTSWANPYKGILKTTGTRQGGHAIAVSGFFTTKKGRYFIIKNSWGTKYGDGGYVYLPQNYCEKYWCAAHVIKSSSWSPM